MNTQYVLEDVKVSLKPKLAALWTSLMFLCIYVDYFHLYMPGMIEDIQAGRVFKFEITQGFLLAALASMTIPALMIFLSVALPAKIIAGQISLLPRSLFPIPCSIWQERLGCTWCLVLL